MSCIRNNYSEKGKKVSESIEAKPSCMLGLICKKKSVLGEPKGNCLILYGE